MDRSIVIVISGRSRIIERIAQCRPRAEVCHELRFSVRPVCPANKHIETPGVSS